MKKIFSIFAAAALFISACSDSVNENSAEGTGKVALNLAIPRFIVPKAQSNQNGRMIMPSTSVIKFNLYNENNESKVDYSKEFELVSSSIDEKYNYVAMELDDVPVGIYSKASIELLDSKGNILTSAENTENTDGLKVKVEEGSVAESLTFYALPNEDDCTEISEYEENFGEAQGFGVDEDTLNNNGGIFHQVYKVTVPDESSLSVTLSAGSNKGDIAVVIYDEFGVYSDEYISKISESSFSDKQVIGEEDNTTEGDYYVVVYANGAVEDGEIKFELLD